MAATGFFYTFTRPRQALPMSMLKYDPIGKDTTTIPPMRRDETRRDEEWKRSVSGWRQRLPGRGGMGGEGICFGRHPAERGTERQTWPAANPPNHSAEKGAVPRTTAEMRG